MNHKKNNINIRKLLLLIGMLCTYAGSSFAQCDCTPISGNLVTNGGFENACVVPPTSFSSEMTATCTPADWPIEDYSNGVFLIAPSGIAVNGVWNGAPVEGNNFFIGDGAWGNGTETNIAWAQTVNVVAGSRYVFSVKYREQQNNNYPIYLKVGTTEIAKSGGNSVQTWDSLCGTWEAVTTGSIQLEIRRTGSNNGSYSNNDFGLDDIQFRQLPSFKAVPQSDVVICAGTSTTLTAVVTGGSGNYSYKWSTGATTQQISVSPTDVTIYSVIITDNVSKCETYDDIKVTPVKLNLDLGNDLMICPTYPTRIYAAVNGGLGSYSYLWNTGSIQSYIDVNYNNPGLYSVTVTDNTSGCTISDNVRTAQWQCQGTQYYQNTSSLPAFSHYNIIIAGNNVTTGTQGNVNVLNGQDVEFHGSSYIELAPGFIANSGSDFNAEINTRCSFGNAYIQRAGGTCSPKLVAVAEYGSGNYSYLWSTGATTKEINVNPSSNTTYSVQIIDNCLGNNATVSYTFEVHYKGAVSFICDNLTTPNGDGHNDIWVVHDNNKTEYAFNAYAFTLDVFNRWGQKVHASSGTVASSSTGFKEGDINWNASSVSDGVYYYTLRLFNCDNTTTYKDWINVVSNLSKRAVDSYEYSDTISFHKEAVDTYTSNSVQISPNPTTGKVKYELGGKAVTGIQVFDAYNREVLSVSNNFKGELDLSNHPEGLYLVRFKTSEGMITRKLILSRE